MTTPRLSPSTAFLALISLFALFGATSSTALVLNELKINPPGTDAPYQYIELLGEPYQKLTDLYLVVLEGDSTEDQGKAVFVVDLDGDGTRTLSSLGVLLIKAAVGGHNAAAGATTILDAALNASSPLNDGSLSLLLVASRTAPRVGVPYDSKRSGILDVEPLASATVLDAVGWSNGDSGDKVYSDCALALSAPPDAAARFPTDTRASAKAAWYFGELSGTSATVSYDTLRRSDNFPSGGTLTPGAPNLPVPSISFIAAQSGVVGDPTSEIIAFTVNPPTLQVTASSGNPTRLPHSALRIEGNNAQRTLSISPSTSVYDVQITIESTAPPCRVAFRYSASIGFRDTARFHTGLSDASAAAAIDANWMLVADDETQPLRLFSRKNSGPPQKEFDFSHQLGLNLDTSGHRLELDLEACARSGDRIYWLGGLGNSKDGELRPNRNRLFATDLHGTAPEVDLSFVGSYGSSIDDGLRGDVIQWDRQNSHKRGVDYYQLASSAAAGKRAKSPDGFTVEGLCVSPSGVAYLGFRAPLVPPADRRKALLLPVLNLSELVTPAGSPSSGRTRFGDPIELDLGGRGIRSIEASTTGFLIVAGPAGENTGDPFEFKIFTWTGDLADPPRERLTDLSGLSPEALVEAPPAPWNELTPLQLLSDCGATKWYEPESSLTGKELPIPAYKKSRSDWTPLRAPAPGARPFLPNPAASRGPFQRGRGDQEAGWTTVRPADFQFGVPLDDTEGNSRVFYPQHDWTSPFLHYNALEPKAPLEFQNPLVAFGSDVGATPLYVGRTYSFVVTSGDSPAQLSERDPATFVITAYDRKTQRVMERFSIPLPVRPSDEYSQFLRQGIEREFPSVGLRTRIEVVSPPDALPPAYRITHLAKKTEYLFLLSSLGYIPKIDTDEDGRTDAQEELDGTDPLDAASVKPVRLFYCAFDGDPAANSWLQNNRGQPPREAANLLLEAGARGAAVKIDAPYSGPGTGAILVYPELQPNGAPNLLCSRGSIRFWFKPNWLLPNWTGTAGPYGWGRLFEVGAWSSDGSGGVWQFHFDSGALFADKPPLRFGGMNSSDYLQFLNAPALPAGWHQIVLTYNSAQSQYFLDGKRIQIGAGSTRWPTPFSRQRHGFKIGSDRGSHQARGWFDEIETFNYVLSDLEIARQFAVASDPATRQGTWAKFTAPLPILPIIQLMASGGAGGAAPLIAVGPVSYAPTEGLAVTRLAADGRLMDSRTYNVAASGAAAEQLATLINSDLPGTIYLFVTRGQANHTSLQLKEALARLGLIYPYQWENSCAWLGIAQKGRDCAWLERIAPPSANGTVIRVDFDAPASFSADGPERLGLTTTPIGLPAPSPVYVLSFDELPPWRSAFIDQPHFLQEPLPSAYAGKSPAELRAVPIELPLLNELRPENFKQLDHSPELRRHPGLDRFVADLESDPIALANFVFTEIEVTDWLDYGPDMARGAVFDLGGLNRSAWAVFQERQGSPAEQCALLVYLLRQAGYPACYLFAPPGSIKFLPDQLSRILQVNFAEAALESTFAVNYPWVAVFADHQWIHLFPWIKDTEISEGPSFYDYLPEDLNSAPKIFRQYLAVDPNLMACSNESDQLLDLLPGLIQQSLTALHLPIAFDELGSRALLRKPYYSRWQDFPRPFACAGTAQTVERLAEFPAIFNTLRLRFFSKANPQKIVDTGPIRIADLAHRAFTVSYEPINATEHNLILRLAPYSAAVISQSSFASAQGLAAENQQLWSAELRSSVILDATDDVIVCQATHKRNQHQPWTIVFAENHFDYSYSETGTLTYDLTQGGYAYETEDHFRKGDALGLVLNLGRVTRRMVDAHVSQLNLLSGSTSTETANATRTTESLGELLHIVGMAYWEYLSRFDELNQRLHKVRPVAQYGHAFAILGAERQAGGNLPADGHIQPNRPALHVACLGNAVFFNGTIHPGSNTDRTTALYNYFLLQSAQNSAAEHHILSTFFADPAAVSSIKLLQLDGASQFKTLTSENYQQLAPVLAAQDPALWRKVVEHFQQPFWQERREAFFTSRRLTSGAYEGGAVLTLDYHGGAGAYISGVGLLNGGFSSQRIPEGLSLVYFRGRYYSVYVKDSEVVSAVRIETFAETYARIVDGAYFPDPDFTDLLDHLSTAFGLALKDSYAEQVARAYAAGHDRGWIGRTASWVSTALVRVFDPVNVLNGEFYVDATDLTLHGPMPISVRRVYLSNDGTPTTLGVGWKLSYHPYLAFNDDETRVFASEPDGSLIVYEWVEPGLWRPTLAANPALNNHSEYGVSGAVNMRNAEIRQSDVGGATQYSLHLPDGSQRLFTVRSFPAGGLARRRPYLVRQQDPLGNFCSFEYGEDARDTDYGQIRRIRASNGNVLGFSYNAEHLITEAYSRDGRRVRFEYDAFADLIAVTLPDGSVIRYEYEHLIDDANGQSKPYSTHRIVREIKPDGRLLLNTYDSAGRVIQQAATVGRSPKPVVNGIFQYSWTATEPGLSGSTTVTDALGRSTRYEYSQSLITRIVDPLGQALSQEWYLDPHEPGAHPRSLKRTTDQRGLVRSFQYDARGNVTQLLLTGNLTGGSSTAESARYQAEYDPATSLLLKTVDPLNNTTRYTYDGYLLKQLEFRPVNSAPEQAVINRFEYGSVTDSSSAPPIQSFGLMTRVTRAFGSPDAAVTETTYDARGFPARRTEYTHTDDPNVVTFLEHNRRGELIEQSNAAGARTRFLYDAMGRRTGREVYEPNSTVPLSWEYSYYNANGELTWSDGPRSTPEDYVWRDYDFAGNLTEEVHWQIMADSTRAAVIAPPGDLRFAVTRSEYDPQGNRIRVTDPNGAVQRMAYDPLNRMIERSFFPSNSSLALSTERLTHEPGGEVETYTDPSGRVTRQKFTQTGQICWLQKPDETILRWNLDLLGRVVREYLANGEYWSLEYDDAQRIVTRRFSAGQIPVVTAYDLRGNLIRSTDEEGQTTARTYDGLNRIKSETGPPASALSTQQRKTFSYDSSGRSLIVINTAAEKVATIFDALGRTISTETISAHGSVIRKQSFAYSPDHHSYTTTEGSGAGSFSTTYFLDAAGRVVLTAFADGARRMTSYDPNGNRLAETDELGHVTRFQFDPKGRLAKKIFPDGAEMDFVYNATDQLLQQSMPGGLVWSAQYDAAGRLSQTRLRAGQTVLRSSNYSYYSSGPWLGKLERTIDARGVAHTTSYDSFLRLSTVLSSGPAPEQNQTLQYRYNSRGFWSSLVQTFAAPGLFPGTEIRRSYDASGQVAFEDVLIDGALVSSLAQTWDAAGRRTQLRSALEPDPGGTIRFTHRADGLLTEVRQASHSSQFNYTSSGLLQTRVNPWRNSTVRERDSRGRPLRVTSTASGIVLLNESLAWSPTSQVTTYAADRTGTGSWDEARAYTYSPRGYLLSENFAPAAGKSAQLDFTFDPAGLGVRQSLELHGDAAAHWELAEQSNPIHPTKERYDLPGRNLIASGSAPGAQAVSAFLDGLLLPVDFDARESSGHWSAPFVANPGIRQLRVTAQIKTPVAVSAESSSSFTVLSSGSLLTRYDPAGNMIQRDWINGANQIVRSQSLHWDGFGRLVSVLERDLQNTGYDWTALYDGLGRRLRTTLQTVTAGVPDQNAPLRLESLYDPEVEFLELAVTINGRRTWKILGLDLNGRYGGAQGIGGLEALFDASNLAVTPLIHDFFGNTVASRPASASSFQWRPFISTGFSGAPGQTPPPLTPTAPVSESLSWCSKISDPTGLICFGARYYDPATARFLSPDPLGHAGSMDLYSYANNDPINFLDPDGRVGRQAYNHFNDQIARPILWLPRNALYWGFFRWIGADHMRPHTRLAGDLSGGAAGVFFVNGMMNSLTVARQNADNFLFRTGLRGGTLIYNPTASEDFEGVFLLDQLLGNSVVGAIRDMFQALGQGLLGLPDRTASLAAQEVHTWLDNNPGERAILAVHSQGGSISVALRQILSYADRQRVDLQTFGGAVFLGSAGWRSQTHYVNYFDPVTSFGAGLSPFGALHHLRASVDPTYTILGAWNAPWGSSIPFHNFIDSYSIRIRPHINPR